MKTGIAIALSLCLSGCLIEMLMGAAIGADVTVQQAGSGMGTMNQVQRDTSQMELQEALEYYYSDNGAYPRSLDALVPKYITAIPLRPDSEPFGYNPIEGTIYQNNKGPSAEDYIMMEDIKAAINSYGTATGYYPPTLDDLYPRFIPTPPHTTTGATFGYENQHGRLTHPHEGRQFEEKNATTTNAGRTTPVKPVNAMGSFQEGDLKDSNSLNKKLDQMGY
jgi:hypothetical protein